MRSRNVLVVCGAALVMVLGACAGESSSKAGVEVNAGEFAFAPSELRVARGQPVQVRLRNDGKILHDWTIDTIPASNVKTSGSAQHDMAEASGSAHEDAAKLHMAAEGGKTATLTVTPAEAGKYTFYCSVTGHREAGMQGTLIVE